jgi:hypothetical protein
MRADIDAHFSRPSEHLPTTHQVWNYWFVPGSYTYLRTNPERIIARDKVEAFVDTLRDWTARNLGLAGVTWPYLSLYVPGCVQGLHNDSTNGRLGFVYSLTRNDRRTLGGETVILHERDLFRSSLDTPAAGTDLFDLVEPRFNRLTLFDDRIPHAVQRIDGPMDPLEGRLVLHGHISEDGVIAEGALTQDAIEDAVAPAREELRASAARNVHGPFAVTIDIADTGEVRQLRLILDRLASPNGADLDGVRSAVIEHLSALQFPPAAAPTRANIPLIF